MYCFELFSYLSLGHAKNVPLSPDVVCVDQWQNGFILYAAREQSWQANTIITIVTSKELKHWLSSCGDISSVGCINGVGCSPQFQLARHFGLHMCVLPVEPSRSHDTNGSWRSRWQFGMAPVETVGRTWLESVMRQDQHCLSTNCPGCEVPLRDCQLSIVNDWRHSVHAGSQILLAESK